MRTRNKEEGQPFQATPKSVLTQVKESVKSQDPAKAYMGARIAEQGRDKTQYRNQKRLLAKKGRFSEDVIANIQSLFYTFKFPQLI